MKFIKCEPQHAGNSALNSCSSRHKGEKQTESRRRIWTFCVPSLCTIGTVALMPTEVEGKRLSLLTDACSTGLVVQITPHDPYVGVFTHPKDSVVLFGLTNEQQGCGSESIFTSAWGNLMARTTGFKSVSFTSISSCSVRPNAAEST